MTVLEATLEDQIVVASLEMLSGRSKKEYAKEAQAVAEAPDACSGGVGPAYASNLSQSMYQSGGCSVEGASPTAVYELASYRRPSSRLGGAGALWHNAGRVIRSV